MAREARQADNEWLPAELLPAAEDGVPDAVEERGETLRLVEPLEREWRPEAPQQEDREPVPVADLEIVHEEPPQADENPAQAPAEVANPIQSRPRVLRDSTLPKPRWGPTGPRAPAPVPTGT